MYEEPTDVHGDFGAVESIAKMDNISEDVVISEIIKIEKGSKKPKSLGQAAVEQAMQVGDESSFISAQSTQIPVIPQDGFFNPDGPMSEFRSVRSLTREISPQQIVRF